MTTSEHLRALVWNYDPSVAGGATDTTVILAVLRVGTWDQIMSAFAHFGKDAVVSVIEKDYFGDRTLPVSVRAFWGNVFWPGSPPPEVADPLQRWRPTRSQRMETGLARRSSLGPPGDG